jgi:tRNA-Thr(GGU) m(6)t(6)A37 methyltransferase TsaA
VSQFLLRPIGTIRTRYASFDDTPVQAALNVDEHAVIELDASYVDGLEGLGEFSHAWLVTWLGSEQGDVVPEPALRQVPFLLQRTGQEVGIFAMRGPRRPNPIGLSLVRLVAVEPPRVTFAGVDMLDGTPLLDLKPYFRDADTPIGDVHCGWYDSIDLRGPVTPRGLSGSAPTDST